MTILVACFIWSKAEAHTPLWTFTPVTAFPPQITIHTTENATIQYLVTNQSSRTHHLQMNAVKGITASGCNPVAPHQSCTLNLSITGSALSGDVIGGPVLCEQGNLLQCYQPSVANLLAIHFRSTPIQYTVTSTVSAGGSISPSTQTVNSGSTIIFTTTPNAGFGVNQWLLDGTVVQTGGTTYQLSNITANHSLEVSFGTVTLTPSVALLALSVNDTANPALTGNTRTLTLVNTGAGQVTNVVITPTNLPSGTSVSPLSCSTISAGGQCALSITPGTTVSSDASSTLCTHGVQPQPSTLTITADGGLSAQVNLYVLGYGCIMQGGFIFSIDDTTPTSQSIGGKVMAVTDSSPGTLLNAPGTPNWGGEGTDLGSNLNETSTQGANDGQTNSEDIVSALTTHYSLPPYSGSSPVDLTTYGAGMCSQLSTDAAGNFPCASPATCYSNWYLPSICEWGQNSIPSLCTAGSTSIQQQLIQNPLTPISTLNFDTFSHYVYWSSTQSSTAPAGAGWAENINFLIQLDTLCSKGCQGGIRCTRALTF